MNLGNLNNLNEEIIDDKNIKTIENLWKRIKVNKSNINRR